MQFREKSSALSRMNLTSGTGLGAVGGRDASPLRSEEEVKLRRRQRLHRLMATVGALEGAIGRGVVVMAGFFCRDRTCGVEVPVVRSSVRLGRPSDKIAAFNILQKQEINVQTQIFQIKFRYICSSFFPLFFLPFLFSFFLVRKYKIFHKTATFLSYATKTPA